MNSIVVLPTRKRPKQLIRNLSKKKIEEMRKEIEDKDENQLARESKEKSDVLNQQIRNLSEELKLPVSSTDLLKEAERRGIGNTAILYDLPGRTGDWRFVPNAPGPGTHDFRSINFN